MRAVYATVERVMRGADIKASAYATAEIMEALESASASVDRLVSLGDRTRPAFAPWRGSIVFDWPVTNNENAYRFWLNQYRLHSLTAITSGDVDLLSQALLWPASGAPYSAVEIDTSGSNSLEIGSEGTGQRSLTIEGVWGCVGSDRTRTAWTLGASVNASASALTLNAPIGIGSIVLIGSERVIVEDRAWADSGQTASALTASMADASITVQTGSAFLPGEEIAIDGERMLIRDVIGNVLTVQRAASGSTLATHAGAAAISWQRACTVERGALGTTAAAHTSGDALSIYEPPRTASALTIAYAMEQRGQENTGYATNLDHIADRKGLAAKKVGGALAAGGIAALEERLIREFGRIRHRAI